MAKYLFPAVFEKEEDMYNVMFPDIDGCYTCGTSIENAYEMAQDALCMTLYELEKQGKPIPEPTDIFRLQCGKDGFTSLVQCDTMDYQPQWTVQEISDGIRNVVEEYGIHRVELRGPYADGSATAGSCIKLMVEFRRPRVSLLQIIELEYRLKIFFGTEVSVIHAPMEDDLFFEKSKKILLYAEESSDTEETEDT